jgi:RNA polymerase sigma-70 factor, ECF subfamily
MNELATQNADLAQRVRDGDKQAEAELVARFQNGIRQIIIRVTGQFALAEELSQETLIVTLRRLRSSPLEDPSKLSAFVAQTARNIAMAALRKERRRGARPSGEDIEEVADLAPGHDTRADAHLMATAVRAVLKELASERDRRILVRHYLDDEDPEAICRDLGINESTFRVILFRARKRFLEKLEARGIRRTDLFSVLLV